MSEKGSPVAGPDYRVLVIDDHPLLATAVSMELQARGNVACQIVHTGEEALAEYVAADQSETAAEAFDLVLSDMAAPTTGHPQTDHLRTTALCEAAYDFAESVLSPGGGFVAKVFKGGSEASLLRRMKRGFTTVRHAKPAASRPESPETYVVAMGFRGSTSNDGRH